MRRDRFSLGNYEIINFSEILRSKIVEEYNASIFSCNPLLLQNFISNEDRIYFLYQTYADFYRTTEVEHQLDNLEIIDNITNINDLMYYVLAEDLTEDLFHASKNIELQNKISKAIYISKQIPTWLKELAPFLELEQMIYKTEPDVQNIVNELKKIKSNYSCIIDESIVKKELNSQITKEAEELGETLAITKHMGTPNSDALLEEIIESSFKYKLYSSKKMGSQHLFFRELNNIKIEKYIKNIINPYKREMLKREVVNYLLLQVVVSEEDFNKEVSSIETGKIKEVVRKKDKK